MITITEKESLKGFAGINEFAAKYNIPASELVACMGEYLGTLGLSGDHVREQRVAQGQGLWAEGVQPGDERMTRLHTEFDGVESVVRGVHNALQYASRIAAEYSTGGFEPVIVETNVLPFPQQASAA